MAAIRLLEETGECTFDLSIYGPRLRPVFFGSRSNQPFEIHYHSFVGEVACGRWAICCCRRYLWGKSFIEFAIVSQWRKYWSILGVFTNSAVGRRNSWDTSLRSFIVLPEWWRMLMAWVAILMYSSVDILFKRVVCIFPIVPRDHLLIVMIPLLLVLIPVVLLLVTLLYLLHHHHPFPPFDYSPLSTELYFLINSPIIFGP